MFNDWPARSRFGSMAGFAAMTDSTRKRYNRAMEAIVSRSRTTCFRAVITLSPTLSLLPELNKGLFDCRSLGQSLGLQEIELAAQLRIFFAQLLQFALHGRIKRSQRFGLGQFLAAGLDADLGVVSGIGIGPKLVSAIVMVKRQHMTPFVLVVVLFVKHAEFEVSQSGIGIGFDGMLERFDGSFVIAGLGPLLSFEEMRVFLLVAINAAGRFAATQAGDDQQQERCGAKPKKHARDCIVQSSKFKVQSSVGAVGRMFKLECLNLQP